MKNTKNTKQANERHVHYFTRKNLILPACYMDYPTFATVRNGQDHDEKLIVITGKRGKRK